MQQAQISWKLFYTLKSGHRIWKGLEENGLEGLAIADRSGDHKRGEKGTPEETDDGILWVEKELGLEMDGKTLYAFVGVSGPKVGNSRVMVEPEDLIMLASFLGCDVKASPKAAAHVKAQAEKFLILQRRIEGK
jgi:hypothetical protein